MKTIALALTLAVLCARPALAQEATFNTRQLTPDTALDAARAALAACRRNGHQVAVAVVDRAGVTQVMLRDRFAGAHTPATASGKAWTAVSFRTNTTELVDLTQAGRPQSGIRQISGAVMIGGGMLIEAQGAILGGIGISGAPGGDADDACARAGIAAIRDKIDF
ncbi:MAG: heme-binding protein [Betaproteobacteria bacterium]|nr:heme-binding protein [Betaproteobacteria bacterium]